MVMETAALGKISAFFSYPMLTEFQILLASIPATESKGLMVEQPPLETSSLEM